MQNQHQNQTKRAERWPSGRQTITWRAPGVPEKGKSREGADPMPLIPGCSLTPAVPITIPQGSPWLTIISIPLAASAEPSKWMGMEILTSQGGRGRVCKAGLSHSWQAVEETPFLPRLSHPVCIFHQKYIYLNHSEILNTSIYNICSSESNRNMPIY